MTGFIAEKLRRRWLAFDLEPKYVRGSIVRFLAYEVIAPQLLRGAALAERYGAKKKPPPIGGGFSISRLEALACTPMAATTSAKPESS